MQPGFWVVFFLLAVTDCWVAITGLGLSMGQVKTNVVTKPWRTHLMTPGSNAQVPPCSPTRTCVGGTERAETGGARLKIGLSGGDSLMSYMKENTITLSKTLAL